MGRGLAGLGGWSKAGRSLGGSVAENLRFLLPQEAGRWQWGPVFSDFLPYGSSPFPLGKAPVASHCPISLSTCFHTAALCLPSLGSKLSSQCSGLSPLSTSFSPPLKRELRGSSQGSPRALFTLNSLKDSEGHGEGGAGQGQVFCLSTVSSQRSRGMSRTKPIRTDVETEAQSRNLLV